MRKTVGSIRALQKMNFEKKKAPVEFYNIATDDEEDNENILNVNAVHEVPPEDYAHGESGNGEDNEEVTASIIVDSGADASIF